MKAHALVLAVAAAAAIAAAAPAGGASLRPHVTVEDAVVRLGDVFDDAGPSANVAIAAAPAPGRRNVFDAAWLVQVARAYQLDWRPGSRFERVVIERAGRVIAVSEIVAQLAPALALEGMPPDSEVELSNRHTTFSVALDAPRTIELHGVSYDRTSGRFSAVVSAGGSHPSAQRLALSGRAYATTLLPVPRRAIAPGDVIRKDDLEVIRVREDRVVRDAVSDPRRLVGTTPRQRLRAGEPVRDGDTHPPVIVERNSAVTIVLQTGSMTLTAQGRAAEDGAKGDVIRVMNLQSKKVVDAVVAGRDLVTIPFAGHRAVN